MTDERQKKTTDEYRNNYDAIFKKCCNQDCNQGRTCPNRSKEEKVIKNESLNNQK
jgi:hypothetical protein